MWLIIFGDIRWGKKEGGNQNSWFSGLLFQFLRNMHRVFPPEKVKRGKSKENLGAARLELHNSGLSDDSRSWILWIFWDCRSDFYKHKEDQRLAFRNQKRWSHLKKDLFKWFCWQLRVLWNCWLRVGGLWLPSWKKRIKGLSSCIIMPGWYRNVSSIIWPLVLMPGTDSDACISQSMRLGSFLGPTGWVTSVLGNSRALSGWPIDVNYWAKEKKKGILYQKPFDSKQEI